MTRSNNIWKPLVFTPSSGASGSTTPVVPAAGLNPRVKTSRQVRRAYHNRQSVASTPSGVYTLTPGQPFPSQPDPADPDTVDPSAIPSRSPTPLSTPLRSSSPPEDTAGWTSDFPPSPQPTASHEHYKTTRANQWTKWTQVVIPLLVQPYLQLLRRTDSLGSVDRQFSPACTCQQAQSRTLKVTCVHFDCKLALRLCMHSPDLVQLSSRYLCTFANVRQPHMPS